MPDSATDPVSRRTLRVAKVLVDARDHYRQYDRREPYFGTAPAALLEGFAALDDVEIHVVSCSRRRLANPATLGRNLFFHPVHVSRLGYMRSLYFESVWRVRQALRRLAPDVVHGHGTEVYAGLCAAFSGRANVITIHGNMRSIARQMQARPFSFHWMAARLESLALRKTRGVLCNSAYTAAQVGRLARRTWHVPNALASAFFQPRVGSRESVPLLLNVGHVAPHKCQVELLEAARQWHDQGLRFRLEFLGGADGGTLYGAQFLDAVAAARTAGWASHAGLLSREETIRRMDAAVALVHVSREESFGLAVAEGLARDLKVFAFNTGGLADVMAGIPAADSFATGNWSALTEAVGSWLRAGAPPPSPSSPTIFERYAPVKVAARHLEVYRELLSTRS
jgi:glycosyltransferase involved in cell wall biosynthesis